MLRMALAIPWDARATREVMLRLYIKKCLVGKQQRADPTGYYFVTTRHRRCWSLDAADELVP